MSARDQILTEVRRALGPAYGVEDPVPRDYRTTALPGDLADLFVERVVDYRARVTRCALGEVADQLREALTSAPRFVVPDGFSYPIDGGMPASGHTALELDAVDAVVSQASVAIADTGTIVLQHGPAEGRRALTLLPDLHVCVVQRAQVVAGVSEAVAALDPLRPQTWISGPSATSDIEMNRVEGVHGPRGLHVILAG